MNQHATFAAKSNTPPSLERLPQMVLQRQCACDQHAGGDEICKECKAAQTGLQRSSRLAAAGSIHTLDTRNSTINRAAAAEADSPRINVNHPRDQFEQEANLAAVLALRSGAEGVMPHRSVGVSDLLQRSQASSGRGPEVTGPTASEIKRLNGKGSGIDASTRGFMETRFQYDFSGVRIHSGEQADRLARSVDARAFTFGNHIVFGQGQYSPGTHAGRFVLAHELAHVVQQRARPNGLQLFRVSPSQCATDCLAPDPVPTRAGPASSWRLTIAVDREQQGLGRLKSGDVGHTWVKLTNDVGLKYSYGFWPRTGFNSKKPFSSVKGCVHHPDTLHEPPLAKGYLAKDYTIQQPNFQSALGHAQTVCQAKPDYNLVSYNCTSFAIDVAKAAGVTPPSSTTLAIHNPNALYEGIEENRSEGHPGLGALLGGLGGAGLGAAIGSAAGVGGAIVGGLIGGLVGTVGGTLIGDVT